MSGKKKCQICERKVPVAKKLCDCGYAFLTLKKCYKCGHSVPIAKKICDCSYVFKQRKKPGFQEIPVILTSDRLRPTRPIRMKRPLYNDSDYIYNVSMAALPKQRRCNARMFTNGRICDKVGFVSSVYEHDDMYDKDLNDAALESIANSIITNSKSNGKNKLEKLYPKRERNKLSKYQCYPSTSNKKTKNQLSNKTKIQPNNDTEVIDKNDCESNDIQNLPAENVKRNYDTAVVSVSRNQKNSSSSNGKKTKFPNAKIHPIENGLKHLIRGEVSKAIKKKVSHSNVGVVNSPVPAFNSELTVKHIKEEITDNEYKETNTKSNEVMKSEETLESYQESDKKLSIEIKSEETLESSEKSKKKLTNASESKEVLESSEKSDDVCKGGTAVEDDISDDEKTLKEIKYSEKNEITNTPKEVGNIEEKPVKKKGGRPRIHPIRPKKPVGRPRKHSIVASRYKRKQENAIDMNIEDNAELTKGLPTDVNNEMDISDTNNSPLKTNKQKVIYSPSSDKKGIKRGRPKGCKDSKPRKIRHDYIERLIARKEDVDGLVNRKTTKKTSKSGSCFLSPPSLMASAKEKHIENEVLDAAEIERIEKRLDKTNPFIIPDNKKELYSRILDEINRRISSQSFQSSSLIE